MVAAPPRIVVNCDAGGLLAVSRECRWTSMDELLTFQKALANFNVVLMVATLVAGQLIGIFGLRSREILKEGGLPYLADGIMFMITLPGAMACLLIIADSPLALVDHQAQAYFGLLVGFVALVVGGVALVAEARFHKRRVDGALGLPRETSIHAVDPVALAPHANVGLLADVAQHGAELGCRPLRMASPCLPLTEATVDVAPIGSATASGGHMVPPGTR